MMIDQMLSNLPDNYNKSEGSNTRKLLTLPADLFDHVHATLDKIREWRDVDKAEGTTLDELGRNAGRLRDGLSDAEYRKRVKVKMIANLSGGEIETLNAVARIFLENRYGGLQEGWSLPVDFPIQPEPAMVLLDVLVDRVSFGIPMEEMESIKSGGVRVNWQWINPQEIDLNATVTVEEQPYVVHGRTVSVGRNYSKHSQNYPLCGTFKAGEGAFL